MTAARRLTGVLVAAVLAFALAACSGLPTSGSVVPGLAPGQEADDPDFAFRPDAPQPGATPGQIVDGFIRAGSGTSNNWAIARQYLTDAFAGQWTPSSSVTIDQLGERISTETSDTTIEWQVAQVATVDDTGVYSAVDTPKTMSFTLAQQGGEWRIAEAPNGIVLDVDLFQSVYHPFPLMYFDPTWQYLVPDMRWFPTTNAATWITSALVEGSPSAWLEDSVRSAFPQDDLLAQPAVPVEGGVASVELVPAALALDPSTLGRMQAQLDASLDEASVSEVEMSASGTPIDVAPATTRTTRVIAQAVGITAAGFGFISGDDLQPIDGLTETIAKVTPAPVSVTLAASQQWAVVRTSSGAVLRAQADTTVLPLDIGRVNLIDPTIDPQGYVWSVPSDAPSSLIAFSSEGEAVDVASAWEGATRITAMQISRDGTRIAAVVNAGGSPSLWVSGIVRDQAGAPQRLGEPVSLGAVDGATLDLGWLDDTTLGILTTAGDDVASILRLQPVGGPVTAIDAPRAAASLAGANIPSGVRMRDAAGTLFVRRGTTWQPTATEVSVLGTQTGTPE